MIKYVKYTHLDETYAFIQRDEDGKVCMDESKKQSFSIILFKLGCSINIIFKDYNTYLKFKGIIQKSCILVDFNSNYDFLGSLKEGGFAEVKSYFQNTRKKKYNKEWFINKSRLRGNPLLLN